MPSLDIVVGHHNGVHSTIMLPKCIRKLVGVFFVFIFVWFFFFAILAIKFEWKPEENILRFKFSSICPSRTEVNCQANVIYAHICTARFKCFWGNYCSPKNYTSLEIFTIYILKNFFKLTVKQRGVNSTDIFLLQVWHQYFYKIVCLD